MRHQIHIPTDSFLKETEREYSNVNSRLLVEMIQNSVDAGATEIKFEFNNTKKVLVAIDNGSGMTESILKKGMLTYAGSIKRDGATGAFGNAKKIVLFCHDSYVVKTQDLVAIGRGVNYRLYKGKYINGTTIKIKFPKAWSGYNDLNSNLPNRLKQIMRMSNIAAQVYWNGELMAQATPSPVELDTSTAIIRKGDYNGGKIIVRFNGLFMFSNYSEVHSYYYDCKGHSRDALTQNRENFRYETKYREDYDAFVAELSNNSASGITAQASFQRNKETARVIDGFEYMGDDLPRKVSKRERSIHALCLVVGEMVGFKLRKENFGFYLDDCCAGMGNSSKIWINSNMFKGDDWEIDCAETFLHELCHFQGHGHNESFIGLFGTYWKKFIRAYSGINPLRAKIREEEKKQNNKVTLIPDFDEYL